MNAVKLTNEAAIGLNKYCAYMCAVCISVCVCVCMCACVKKICV